MLPAETFTHLPNMLKTLVLLNPDILCFANSVDPDQLALHLWEIS